MCFAATEGLALDNALNKMNGDLCERYGFLKKEENSSNIFL